MSIQQMQSKLSYSNDQLVDASKKHVQFLRDLHKNGATMAPASFLRHSLVRYKDLWLPLVASYHQHLDSADDDETVPPQQDIITLVPPPDVAWLWHCHRLAPGHYENYVKKMFAGKLLEATPPFCFQDPCAFDEDDNTQRAWKEKYPDEPFFLEPVMDFPSSPEIVSPDPDQDYVGDHDLIASAKSQAAFLWQISGHRFADDAFLQEGVRRYILFLEIRDNTLPLVPTFQIDLMWHTHMLLSTDKYHQDCIRIRGKKFHHDDSLHDRTPGSNLDQAYKATIQLWERKYKDMLGCYPVQGGMYRGEAPASYWSPSWVPTTTSSNDAAAAASNTSTMMGATGATSSGKNLQPLRPDFIQVSSDYSDAWKKLPMEGYVFGCGSQGVGHYSLDERSLYIEEAYRIQLYSLNQRIESKRIEMEHIVCNSRIGCWGGRRRMKPVDRRKYDALAKERVDLIKKLQNIDSALRQVQYQQKKRSDFALKQQQQQYQRQKRTEYAQQQQRSQFALKKQQYQRAPPPRASSERAPDTAIQEYHRNLTQFYVNQAFAPAPACGGGGSGGCANSGGGGGGCGGNACANSGGGGGCGGGGGGCGG